MVQPKYSPEEALQKIKLMMKYDSSKTLNENRGIVKEQVGPGEAANIAQEITTELLGDVKTVDLDDILEILKTKVFGQTYEEGGCLLNKVATYFSKGVVRTSDMFTTLVAFSPELWGLGKSNLIDAINNTQEYSEPQFEDVKRRLISAINSESNGFCKTNKSKPKTGENKPENSTKKTGGVVKKTYKLCSGAYQYGCKTDPTGPIGKVQACLGLVSDGKFGPKTKAALAAKSITTFTDLDVDKICGKTVQPVAEPEISGEVTTNNPNEL